MTKNEERRSFFRMDDELIFDYRVIDDENTEVTFDEEEPIISCMKILDEIKDIDSMGQPILQRISMHNPSIADYLRNNNRKFDIIIRFLTEELLAKFVLQADKRSPVKVNLSAGGVGFYADESLEKGTLLKVKLILMPTYDCIINSAVVVGTEVVKGAEKPYRVSCKFVELDDHDEQRIIRHIYHKQIEEHKKAKQEEKNKKN